MNSTCTVEKRLNSGFSLIELAIVLVVIGLIMAGVLKGQQLIESARLKSVMSQVNQFRYATGLFWDQFGGWPGDYPFAKEHIHASLRNGNGDGLITGSEAQQFWAHLAAAQFLSFSGGTPASRLGGGFTVVYRPAEDMPGHWYLLGDVNHQKGDGALLTPAQVFSLDRQMDTGVPTNGSVRSFTGVGAQGECVVNERYNLQNTAKACIVYFQF